MSSEAQQHEDAKEASRANKERVDDDDEEVPASEPEAENAEMTTEEAAAAAAPQKKAAKTKKKVAKTKQATETRAAYEAKRHKRGLKLRFNELLRKCISRGAVKDLALRSGMLTTVKETKEFIRRLYASLTTTLMVAALYHTTGAKRRIIQLKDVQRAYQSQTGWALYAHDMNTPADFTKCRLLSQKTLNARAAAKRLQKMQQVVDEKKAATTTTATEAAAAASEKNCAAVE